MPPVARSGFEGRLTKWFGHPIRPFSSGSLPMPGIEAGWYCVSKVADLTLAAASNWAILLIRIAGMNLSTRLRGEECAYLRPR
jgi:hypothetical protein